MKMEVATKDDVREVKDLLDNFAEQVIRRMDDTDLKIDTLMATIGEYIERNDSNMRAHEFRISNLERAC
jgi:uncharacterized protein with von Willebrand factor type A (vWA) domain